MDLISPTELAKQKVQSVQEYTFLAGRSLAVSVPGQSED
jgi:hypothetical protein